MRVLITGAAGSIGRVVSAGLTSLGHDVIGLDILPGSDLIADSADPAEVHAAVASTRPEAIVHLAGIPTESALPDALTSHVITTAALLEAMIRCDVRRIVYASSNHAVGRTPRAGFDTLDHRLGVDTPPRPDTFYGVGKVAAEALLGMYVDRHGIDAVCTRIGSFLERPTSRRNLASWLSHDDCVRMFHAALTAPSPGLAVLYGISNNTRGWWDLAPGRALGYHPQDDAEDWATEIEATPETDEDIAEAAAVGGPFATPKFERPAFQP
ncbi:MAG: NAD(P)-dependent oxidoreductase [Marmoricola sp.]|jgi:uronate dehydrogenase|nr:NAD(P)-dependent oxidoreductase [Marmoricola sp.]